MVFKGIGKIVGSVADIGKNVVSKVAGMAAGFMTKVLGLQQKKKINLNEQFAEYNENFFSKNPLIGGLITLENLITKNHFSEKEDFNVEV